MPDNEWDDYAADWDGNTVASEYANNAYGELVKAINFSGLDILDFGCGTGLLCERLSGEANQIVALDGSPKMIEQLKRKALANVFPIVGFLSQGLIDKNALLQKRFDLITASSVCAFLPDYEDTLRLLGSLLKPNGTFVQWDWLTLDGSSETGFSKAEVYLAMKNTGFKDVKITQPFVMEDADSDLPVLMAAAKMP